MSIQSKLLIMLLAVSLVSAIVVGVIGFINGRDSLRASAFHQLTTIRELRGEEIQREFSSLQLGVQLDSRNASAVDATTALVDGFAQLQSSTLSADDESKLNDFYAEQFVPALEKRSGNSYSPDAFVPATPAGRYLQAHYTDGRAYDDYDAGLALDDAGDGSAWSAASAQYNPYFKGLVDDLGYEDVLVMNREGDVVYSAYKSVDLGVSMKEEPYTNSALTQAFDQVMRNGSLDEVVTTDFERYLPSLNVPTAWVVSPVGSATNIVGAMAVQIPITQINSVMTGNEKWSAQGLGTTGEVYLAGPDKTMRSVSRLLTEHPKRYAATVVDNGTSPAVAKRIVAVKGTVELQPVDFEGTRRALQGKSGTAITADYTSSDSLVAYAPLQIDGLNWVIVAHMDAAEAFAPVDEFTRNLVISTLALLLIVSMLSLLLAQVFTRPVRRLVDAVRAVAAGDLTVRVPAVAHDEFGDLGRAFNDMSASLRTKQDLIDEQRTENEKLLLTLMPESMAKRYREGEEVISEQHDDVAVVFAELVGFDEYVAALSSTEEMAALNTLVRGFDEAADRTGVEKVRTLRGGYLASSGLIVPRVDNARRAVEFALEMRRVVERFNAAHDTRLDLRAGVDMGPVTSGLVGRTSLAYDLWGDAVSLAYAVRGATTEPGVYVSQAVRDRLADSIEIVAAGAIDTTAGQQQVWRVTGTSR
ncbi:HAMP domain-containing protein [Glaciibacter flavus]|uniref:HAMP domain-containing protein n=1 Tax=Orlajensenia flava TaxID=2565934 RepID=A0A4S4FVZ3_9MICO|nr:HAMP domain-containing protein [Glaciibacter flavus]